MSKVTLYTNPNSRGQIAHWMLEEVGEPYETVWLPYGSEGNRAASFLAVNPMGKLPTVTHGAHVVTEAAAVCLYLADAFPGADLLPRPDERADYYRWTLFAAGPVEQAVTTKMMGWEVPPEREVTVGFGSFDATVSALEGRFTGRDYVCGDHFTAADVYVGSQVMWGMMFGTLPKRPALAAYAERLAAREAAQRATALNDAQRAAEPAGS